MPVKILIIEDDRDIASIESDYLVAYGFETEIQRTFPVFKAKTDI